jgi:alpha-ribazole phosphatase
MGALLTVWRHPRPAGVAGRCIGRTDVAVDPRKARRLAHRIRRQARRQGLKREVWTSPLRRCADVGRWLARWGWVHHVDVRLLEVDFGDWDGLAWADVDAGEISRWTDDFADHAPGGGESVRQLMARCRYFLSSGSGARCVVGHAGWINAARWIAAGRASPGAASEWPPVLGYGAGESLFSNSGGAESQ